jgi:hypothetical protein
MIMEITTEIDKKAGLRKHKVTGDLTVESLLAELGKIYSGTDFDADMDVLWDLRDAKFPSVSSAEVQRVSDFVAAHWGTGGKSRAAMVVSRDFEFGMTRMYEIFLESRTSVRVRVFRDLDEALKWIGS